MTTRHRPLPSRRPTPEPATSLNGCDRRRHRPRSRGRRLHSRQRGRGIRGRFADFVGVAHAIGVASGTDAIEMALRACGIGSGDLVFTVSHTAVATVAAIERAGATPVLVDVEPGTYTMAPRELRACLQIAADRPAGGGPAGAHLWPAGRIVGPRRDRPGPWLAADRGLRAEPRRALSRQAGRIVRRSCLLQLLPDKEPRRSRTFCRDLYWFFRSVSPIQVGMERIPNRCSVFHARA